LDTQTAWKREGGKDYYSLGSLWYYIKNKDVPPGVYARNAPDYGLLVLFGDRKEIADYFTGAISSSN
jgi:hypothetical protein